MFRFTIRDLLWLTVVVALALAFALDRRSLQDDHAAQLRAAEEQERAWKREQEKMERSLWAEKIQHEVTRREWEVEKIRRAAKLD